MVRKLDAMRRLVTTGSALAVFAPSAVYAQEAGAVTGTAAKLAAAKGLYGANAVMFLQVAPPVFAQLVFFSPLATMRSIREKRSTGDLPMLPYTMMACNGFLWMCYGGLVGDTTVIAANVSALCLGLFYCTVFLKHRSPTANIQTPLLLAGTAAAAVASMVTLLPHQAAIDAVGMTGCGVVVAMFGGPLQSIKKVIAEKSTASLPFPMAVATCANCLAWALYGMLVADPYIYLPNMLGLLSGITQLALFAKFGFTDGKSL
eukprot:TRINITY_DN8736_c0_g1_i1.p1 TRINITY_DN8736_c0_g1~~TRINITY_DN8736_c0_g1_i1.p1  ORF type:complete len:260 (+),score=45.07 TRINITY_DN8736_c0_g1_i1:19-798(+)